MPFFGVGVAPRLFFRCLAFSHHAHARTLMFIYTYTFSRRRARACTGRRWRWRPSPSSRRYVAITTDRRHGRYVDMCVKADGRCDAPMTSNKSTTQRNNQPNHQPTDSNPKKLTQDRTIDILCPTPEVMDQWVLGTCIYNDMAYGEATVRVFPPAPLSLFTSINAWPCFFFALV